MGKRLDTAPISAPLSGVTDLISGAAVSGLAGAVVPAPQVLVASVTIVDKTGGGTLSKLYKGASGGSAAGTEVWAGSVSSSGYFAGWPASGGMLTVPLDLVLEAGEFLTFAPGGSGSGTAAIITVSAEITF